jgi:hypothetical protein
MKPGITFPHSHEPTSELYPEANKSSRRIAPYLFKVSVHNTLVMIFLEGWEDAFHFAKSNIETVDVQTG